MEIPRNDCVSGPKDEDRSPKWGGGSDREVAKFGETPVESERHQGSQRCRQSLNRDALPVSPPLRIMVSPDSRSLLPLRDTPTFQQRGGRSGPGY